MMVRQAACSCGQLTASVEGEPVRVSICHCLACQRRTGSVFGAQARFPAQRVQARGRKSSYVRVGDSGGTVTFYFCPDCGGTVYFLLAAMPGFCVVPVGAFADPSFPPPSVSVYEVRKHPWLTLPATMEHLD